MLRENLRESPGKASGSGEKVMQPDIGHRINILTNGSDMNRIQFALIAIIFTLAVMPAHAAEDVLGNLAPDSGSILRYEPGSWIILPDGSRTIIREYLPDGTLRTEQGAVISPDGVILEGEGKGAKAVLLEPEKTPGIKPEDAKAPEPGIVAVPGETAKLPEKVVEEGVVAVPGMVEEPAPEKRAGAPTVIKPDSTIVPEKQGPLTIVELLPKTDIPQSGKESEKKAEPDKRQTVPEKQKQKNPEPEKKPVKPEQKKAEPEKRQAKPEPKKAEQEQKYKRPAPGQEMRIPPDAAKTGDLSFLEGCWQGTRPEYYSKRTIRECFCFDGSGRIGKRRIYDRQHAGMCIGAARASLSSGGVLSITSQGAACTSGDKWGSARMTCRNSGPKTPCSWIFPDAQGGRQAYTIPFVRVESCGR